MRHFLCASVCLLSGFTMAADQTPAEKAIAKALADLEAARTKLEDPLEQAKIDKAIGQLELIAAGEEPDAKPAPLAFAVPPALLKKKFGGKALFNSKSGELTLVYDFSNKLQLSDFDVANQKLLVANKALYLDAAEILQHKAKFRSFAVAALIHIKSMRSVGITSTNGSHLGTGGLNPDTLYLGVPDGAGASKMIPDKARSGTIPVALSVTAGKTSVRWGDERLASPTVRKDDVHQIVLQAGAEGCAYSNLMIVGVPDPDWFKEFLDAQ